MRIVDRQTLDEQILIGLWRDGDPEVQPMLPGWVQRAEEQIAAELRVGEMVVRASEELESAYLTLPVGFLEAIDLRVTGWPGPLLPIGREQAARMLPGGLPRHYALVGNQLELLPDPTPALNQPSYQPPLVELAYYARPPALEAPTDSHGTLRAHSRIYLWSALAAAASDLGHENLATWAQLYGQAKDAANVAWERARSSGGRLNARIRAA